MEQSHPGNMRLWGLDCSRERDLPAMQKRHRIFEGEDLESYFFFTFLEALHVKGETSDELLGFCKANVEVKVLSTEQSGETEFIIGRTSLSNSSTLFIIF